MKKIAELLRPFSSIVLGTLILLYFLNNLSIGGGLLAVGIIALVLAAYYITIGILNFTLSRRMSIKTKHVFETISVTAFPAFMFVLFLVTLINGNAQFGPAGWVLSIIYLVVSISSAIMLVIASFSYSRVLKKTSQLLGMAFALILVLDILFHETGNAVPLGQLDVVLAFIYIIYAQMLFVSFLEAPKAESKPVPSPEAPTPEVEKEPEEEASIEAPVEETKAE